MNQSARRRSLVLILFLAAALLAAGSEGARKGKKKHKAKEDPYAGIVWPPPPDPARIKLVAVLTGRADVEAKTRFRKLLLGESPQSIYDILRKPFAVAYDSRGRLLVTDSASSALLRFDRDEGRLDVFGTRGNVRLKQPLGLDVGVDDSVYVADAGISRVLKLDPEGKILAVFGSGNELTNPTDVALSPDGTKLYVSDSRAHRVVVFDEASGELVSTFGKQGSEEGELRFPTAVAFDSEGDLFVVDQLNARVQLFAPDGEYLDHFGGRGVGFGNFSRPKDVAVDEVGLIYVTDNAFNNVQIFDADFTLLTFIGHGGRQPGEFWGASGVAVRGDEFAVVDQLGARVQIFRFVVAKGAAAASR